jgi:hypothetical protein
LKSTRPEGPCCVFGTTGKLSMSYQNLSIFITKNLTKVKT